MKQRLHAQLDGAIMAAKNNDTFGVLMELEKVTEGLAAINTPSYFSLMLHRPIMARRLLTHRRQAQPAKTREQQRQQRHQQHLPTINLTQ